ncbi:hypothetical protein JHK85_008859 [Glycine max]|nr:hypothetical protein JHK85_008859 [Glycine max]
MVGFLLLLNQLICKFNTLVRDILEEIFPSIAERIFSVIPRNGLPSSGSDAITEVPGFRSFVIEAFATNCCLYSVLDRSFEFHDANTFVLFGEIVLAQKVMYEKFGDDFLVNFVSKGFSSAHCPPDQAEQYRQKLQGGDFKALKSFYQSLVENLRVQQNGSLVFR